MLSTPRVAQAGSKSNETSSKFLSVKSINHFKLWSDCSDLGNFLNISLSDDMPNEKIHFQHRTFKFGQRVCRLGEEFDAIYYVYSGFFKTVLFDESGHEQVLNFPMRGDILGLDSMHSGCRQSEVVAQSDCNVIVIPYDQLCELSRKYAQVEQSIMEIFSKELIGQWVGLTMLGKASAEARVCQFLMKLSDRFLELGYSRSERMTRLEIGSYLGITLETVSRILTALNDSGIVKVHQKSICINDIDALKNLLNIIKFC